MDLPRSPLTLTVLGLTALDMSGREMPWPSVLAREMSPAMVGFLVGLPGWGVVAVCGFGVDCGSECSPDKYWTTVCDDVYVTLVAGWTDMLRVGLMGRWVFAVCGLM